MNKYQLEHERIERSNMTQEEKNKAHRELEGEEMFEIYEQEDREREDFYDRFEELFN